MRQLRSLLIGDASFYPSEFVFGIAQGMFRLGHWHTQCDIRCQIETIAKKAHEVQPDVLWGHMLLWSPGGARHTDDLLALCSDLRRRYGTKVLLHDGDARKDTRHPYDVSAAVDLALCNHTADRSAWRVPQLRWPYFAFGQEELAAPRPELACDLAFAGRKGGGIYAARTELLEKLQAKLGERFKLYPSKEMPHTLFRTRELAVSATAMLGHGRSAEDAPGWCDVRVFLLPGAGAVLIHDAAHEWLEPGVHFVPCRPYDVESIIEAIAIAQRDGAAIRRAAFQYVQAHHSAVVRVRQALEAVDL